MMRALVVGLVSGFLFWAAPAAAKCKGPDIAFAPKAGSYVKPAVTWVSVPGWRADQATISVESRHVVETTITTTQNDAFTTHQIAVSFPQATRIIGSLKYDVVVDLGDSNPRRASYVVPHQDFLSQRGDVALDGARHESDSWTCSHTEAIVATPSVSAPAYRIEWAPTEADYRAGKREALVVPWNMDAFWGETDGRAEISLGYLNCFGETISENDLRRGVFVGVAALRGGDEPAPVNPTEIRFGEPLRLTRPAPEPSPEPGAVVVQEEPEPRTCGYVPAPPKASTAGTATRRLALVGILLGLLGGMLVGRRFSIETWARIDSWSLPQVLLIGASIPAALTQMGWLGHSVALPIGIAAFAVASAASFLAATAQQRR